MMYQRDFDVAMCQRADDYAGLEYRWHLTDLAFLEKRENGIRPFLAKMRDGLHALAQIRKIRIQITFEMQQPVIE